MNSYYKYTSIQKSSFFKRSILIQPINIGETYWKYSPHFAYIPAIMNLILRTVRLENFMTPCRDKLYHHAVSNRIKFNVLIIVFDKMTYRKSLPSSSTESEIERITDFKQFGL